MVVSLSVQRNPDRKFDILDRMNFLVDTHAHLCDPIFDADLSQVLQKAETAGIMAVIAVGENMSDAAKNLELAARHRIVHPAAGLYPTVLDLKLADQMCDWIRTHKDRLVAIGEVGLDYWVIKSEAEREMQREIFRGFVELGKELGLPLNVHSRSAGRHTVELLLEASASKVQMHAFDGKFGTAMPAIEAGYFFSIPPSIVRSEQKQKLVRNLPLSCLLVETDSPVLGPAQRERNEPANAVLALKAIAELKKVSEAEVIEAVTENTRKLYRITNDEIRIEKHGAGD
jgi:TatD DNase family protein